MPVEAGNEVKVTYTGTLDDGTVFDTTDAHGGEPLCFIVGSGQIIKGFDDAVLGMEAGDEKEIRLEPEDAYGQPDPRLVLAIPLDRFPPDLTPEVGMMLHLSSPDGDQIQAMISEVGEDQITLDLNPPLAGKVLNFKIKVEEFGEPDPSKCAADCSCCSEHEHEDEE
ncbi:MAG TPA: peptidylprolyl isomerase [Candidatus Lokiarchaeia archaeon]|nr:peptidylprolyl isomerase [Candidatus Lokiarchaeia archaeon]